MYESESKLQLAPSSSWVCQANKSMLTTLGDTDNDWEGRTADIYARLRLQIHSQIQIQIQILSNSDVKILVRGRDIKPDTGPVVGSCREKMCFRKAHTHTCSLFHTYVACVCAWACGQVIRRVARRMPNPKPNYKVSNLRALKDQ